jgi:peptidoglycan hydrolase-like protein with peptidoglycan-binding domain
MPLIKRGSKGKAVKILQIILGGLDVDGSFGWKTLNAVIAFQKKHGLEADGVVGPKTWRALFDTLL